MNKQCCFVTSQKVVACHRVLWGTICHCWGGALVIDALTDVLSDYDSVLAESGYCCLFCCCFR